MGGKSSYRPQSRRERGFTLVEFLATMGVMGIIVSLILPAIMSARGRARRSECIDHLRQIGVAAASYQSAHGVFPYTTTGVGPNPVGLPRSISPHALLLPYMELGTVVSRIDFSEPGSITSGEPASNVNAELLRLTVPLFLCPDDAPVHGGNNYRANMGVIPSPGILLGASTTGLPTESDTGAFRINRALSPSAFSDGLSHTAMFSEKLIGGLDPARFVPPRDCFYSPFPIELVEDAVLACEAVPGPNPPHDAYCGTTWLFGGFDQSWYNHILVPNSPVPDCASQQPGGHGSYTARSFHAGGVNSLFADGSVHVIGENLDLHVWRAYGTRAGGEAL